MTNLKHESYVAELGLKLVIPGSQSEALPHAPGPKVIKVFSCSTQLSMKFSLLINMKMPTIVGIFIFISRENLTLSYV